MGSPPDAALAARRKLLWLDRPRQRVGSPSIDLGGTDRDRIVMIGSEICLGSVASRPKAFALRRRGARAGNFLDGRDEPALSSAPMTRRRWHVALLVASILLVAGRGDAGTLPFEVQGLFGSTDRLAITPDGTRAYARGTDVVVS